MSNLSDIYAQIQKKLFYMIPEKWERIYLYASVIEHYNGIQTGEMFFYYYPKSVLKKNPINVYEVPNKFNIDEQEYLKLAEILYDEIKELRASLIQRGEEPWSNITIKVENFRFNVEYHYEDLINSQYTNYERHLIWRYKYLDVPLSSYQKKDRQMVEEYLSKEKYYKSKVNTYDEGIYSNIVSNIIEYNKQDIEEEKINNEEVNKEENNEDKEIKQEVITSQILKY